MKVGINVSNLADMQVHRKLIAAGHVDFVEILLDNMLHLSPDEVAKHLGDVPVACHILRSTWLDDDTSRLSIVGTKVRDFVQVLKPLYVSDHLMRFASRSRRLPCTLECFYDRDRQKILESLDRWQSLLGLAVFFENFPSVFEGFGDQVGFFDEALRRGSGLLFDLSNAWIAQANTGYSMSHWQDLAAKTKHFHIGALQREASGKAFIAVDTHDGKIHDPCLVDAAEFRPYLTGEDVTLVIERDGHIDLESWGEDIAKLRSWSHDS